MKKILFLLIVAGTSVSFTVPVKKVIDEEVKNESITMLMFKYQLAR